MADDKKPDEKAAKSAGKADDKKPDEKAARSAKPAARIVDQSARAADGLKRFKLRLDGHPSGGRGQKYVLAADPADAIACYLAAEAVEPGEVDGKSVEVIVKEMPD